MIECICNGKHKVPALAVDIIITNTKNNPNKVVLIKRASEPYKNSWAIPGGFIKHGETIKEAGYREALEETGLKIKNKKINRVYSKPDRDPRGHVISIVVTGTAKGKPKADTDAKTAKWFKTNNLPKLAFDHQKIINDHLKTGGN
ncbi:NUDIX family hydrolase [Methanonatronarchaeum thermophilum]|uniref:NUDIX family hydrolase n=1 Tax=Methanonatronarchaeum thermophilum TaxID=1927129 RepID=A0A1Y3GBA8_9EURY|nr:NUDIX hydrolase [Methanonatronarchaeum thermophilum]OUJ18741.1 NUDIX family hydrolase [Methanonatronarchaeum thermophilum]